MTLGFSTGCLYKTEPRLAPATIQRIRDTGCNAIEFMVYDQTDVGALPHLSKRDLAGFEYVSLHAPSYNPNDHAAYVRALDAIQAKHWEIGFNTIVIHPETIVDFDFFKNYDLPFAVENMDNRKSGCRTIAEMEALFATFDVPMVLDINHCLSNDPSLQLAYDMANIFHDRIKQIHLSGLAAFHEPLFQTNNTALIDAIPNLALPIIIESTFDNPAEIATEYTYVTNHLQTSLRLEKKSFRTY